jgi:hypothetical protein
MRRLSIITCLNAMLLAACGGGAQLGTVGTGTGSSSGGSSGGTTVTAASITISSSMSTVPADGSSGATITVLARDASNNLIPGVAVTFTASAGGGIVVANYTTNSSGAAIATLTSVGAAVGAVITVTANSGALTKQVPITVVQASASGTVTVSMGSGTGAAFMQGVIAISTTSLSAGGSTSLQVNLIDQTGAPYTTSTTVTFSSPCVGQNLATITGFAQPTGTPTIATTTGTATATYVATGCSGSDLITATATPNNQNLSASGTVTVSPAAIGSIKFISAQPATMTLKGLGSVGGSSTSTVVFQVLDDAGGARPGATVNFSLSTTVGGVTFIPASGITDANGKVQTVVSSGTVAEPVTVKASTTVPANGANPAYTITTESNALTISTGIPASGGISLAVACYNQEAWNIDGVTVPVTVRMRDRFTNPVPDGTTVNFHTLLGHIDPSCQTGSTPGTAGTGTCTVTWVSQTPYVVAGNPQSTHSAGAVPSYYDYYSSYCAMAAGGGTFVAPNGALTCNGTTNARSPILAYAIGEESFVDAVGNGVFNSNLDTVAWDASNPWNNFGTYSGPWGALSPPVAAGDNPKPFQDVGDPFNNEWELSTCYAQGTVCDPIYVLGEFYYDFFNTGTWAPPDGLIESALCDADTTGAIANPLCSQTSSTVGIGASNIIILSGSTPIVTFNPAPVPSGYTIPGAGVNLAVTITDERYQQMPAGTTVALTINPSTAGTINGASSYKWPCSADVGGRTDVFNLTLAQGTTSAGILTVTVTTPAGIITNINYALAN